MYIILYTNNLILAYININPNIYSIEAESQYKNKFPKQHIIIVVFLLLVSVWLLIPKIGFDEVCCTIESRVIE